MKTYVGDSVYADFNDYHQLVLTTENGDEASNTIYLEPDVWTALVRFVADQRSALDSTPEAER